MSQHLRLGRKMLGLAGVALLAVSSGAPAMADPPPAAPRADPASRAADEAVAALAAADLYQRWGMPGDAAGRARSAGIDEGEFRKSIEAHTPLGRIGQPNDIAPAAVFLASSDSGWITGETLYIAGGYR